ncbi:hypothetical protein DS745_09345 [Anaerobacillus alkaliphilus]|uniref:UDP-N-acetyl-alpha-D-muramoyl-L-alanyl-L-glutamate epimerase n=1 Tax=Anaerobacillus alkaliphilus TaxID=1548597 RepID=A0A4Q0VTC9_9BACI|nr:hypothetical protein [Anaerobacillus alkaliphilus]RXJ01673.1 hypothetical protein DS745_09345 [Anaerobacillus alkaliphilus]
MNILYVYKPLIEKDTVYYHWNFTRNPNVFKRNEFYIKYDGLFIEDINLAAYYEIFLGLIIPILKSLNDDFLILFPKEIPEATVDFWLSINEATNITVFPTVKEKSLLWGERVETKQIGILLGGGKDSLFALKLNEELFGKENLLVVSFVFPIDYSMKNDLDIRRDSFTLKNVKEAGITSQKIYTDFRSIFSNYTYFNTLHTQLYFLMSYPLYVKYNLSYLTYSYEFTHYWNVNSDGERFFHFKKSRPEFDQFLSNYMYSRFGKQVTIFNSNYYLSETLAFQMIHERYKALNDLMMCEAKTSVTKKWCEKCYKCGEYVLYCLKNKYVDQSLNFDHFLTESEFIKNIIRIVEDQTGARNEDGNIHWFQGLISPIHYMSFCHIIYSIDLNYWRDKLSQEAIRNLGKLIDWFGARDYRILDSYSLEALQALELPFEKEMINILDQHTTPDDSEVLEILYGNNSVKIDYRLQYPLSFIKNATNKNDVVSSEIIQKSLPQFHTRYESQVVARNLETMNEIPFEQKYDYRGVSFYINKSAPAKGDMVELTYCFNNLIKDRFYHLHVTILSPYTSPIYKNRFKYKILPDMCGGLEEDIAFWDKENSIHLFFQSTSEEHKITIKIETLFNCEPWNWGKAAELIIKTLDINEISKIERNHISWSSPFSKQI